MTERDTVVDAIDAAYNRRRGITANDAMTDEERAELRRKAEEAALSRTGAERAEAKHAGQQLAKLKRVLLSTTAIMRHGHALSAGERRALVDSTVRRLGGDVSSDVRSRIAQLVDEAADALAEGDRITGQRRAEEVAVDIVNSGAELFVPKVDDDEDEDPASLAAQIPRA
jgi:hypothetical protein